MRRRHSLRRTFRRVTWLTITDGRSGLNETIMKSEAMRRGRCRAAMCLQAAQGRGRPRAAAARSRRKSSATGQRGARGRSPAALGRGGSAVDPLSPTLNPHLLDGRALVMAAREHSCTRRDVLGAAVAAPLLPLPLDGGCGPGSSPGRALAGRMVGVEDGFGAEPETHRSRSESTPSLPSPIDGEGKRGEGKFARALARGAAGGGSDAGGGGGLLGAGAGDRGGVRARGGLWRPSTDGLDRLGLLRMSGGCGRRSLACSRRRRRTLPLSPTRSGSRRITRR